MEIKISNKTLSKIKEYTQIDHDKKKQSVLILLDIDDSEKVKFVDVIIK